MKYPSLAIATLSLILSAPALAENSGPAMKAENGMKMESHDKMSGTATADGMAMKPMAMKKTEKKPMDAMSMKADPMKADKDMKH